MSLPTSVSRRRFLGVTGGVAAALGLPGCATLLAMTPMTGELLRSKAPLPRPFEVPLPIPAVVTPTRRSADTDYYDVVARRASQEILPGLMTPILGYGGTFPGPTIVSRRGRRTVVRHVNHLGIPMVVHLHGGHTTHESDGYPTDLVLPVGGDLSMTRGMPGRIAHGEFSYVYPMNQRAATLWYHDHRMDFTGATVYRGLAGFHLVHDEEEESLPLPAGARDVPLMITDRAFDDDGALLYPSVDPTLLHTPGVREEYMEGVLGDVVLVNGAPWPELEVTASTYRFRLLNASNARRYELALDPPPRSGPAFTQIGSDGGLLAAPIGHDTIIIAQAERFDVVVDFTGCPVGSTVTMINKLGELESTRRVMRFRVTRRVRDDAYVPHQLSTFERLQATRDTVTRRFTFARTDMNGQPGWTINGEPFDVSRIEASCELDRVERWRFTTDVHHPIHVHLNSFQVLRNGEFDQGWKDTVDVHPAEIVDVLVRFTDHTGIYLVHCHNLEHEDMAMMANFRTVAPR